MNLALCRGNFSYLLILGVTFLLEISIVHGQFSLPRSSGPNFGCGSVKSKEPQWSNEEIPAMEVDSENFKKLKSALRRIYTDFLGETKFNNVDNFLSFYDAYKTLGRPADINKFLSTYQCAEKNANQNIALLNAIAKDKFVLRINPNISKSMFLAATVPKAPKEFIQSVNTSSYTVRDTKEFKQTTAVIKVLYVVEYPNIRKRGRNKELRNHVETSEVYILFRPEVNWNQPIIVTLGFDKFYLNTGRSSWNTLIPDQSVPVAVGREIPIRLPGETKQHYKLPGWTADAPKFHYKFLNEKSKFITNVITSPEASYYRINWIENPLIFIGKPYCSSEETSEKYDLTSPYRAIFMRNKKDMTVKHGVFVALTDGTNLSTQFIVIEMVNNSSHLIVVPTNFEDIDTYGRKNIRILEDILSETGLAGKLKKLNDIIHDANFMKVILENNDFKTIKHNKQNEK